MKAGIPSPCVDTSATAPEGLPDVINCGCKALGKACSTEICSSHKHSMSCTTYCVCTAGAGCYNPVTVRNDVDANNEDETDSDQDFV